MPPHTSSNQSLFVLTPGQREILLTIARLESKLDEMISRLDASLAKTDAAPQEKQGK